MEFLNQSGLYSVTVDRRVSIQCLTTQVRALQGGEELKQKNLNICADTC